MVNDGHVQDPEVDKVYLELMKEIPEAQKKTKWKEVYIQAKEIVESDRMKAKSLAVREKEQNTKKAFEKEYSRLTSGMTEENIKKRWRRLSEQAERNIALAAPSKRRRMT